MITTHFLVPGDINTISGGYLYDKQMLQGIAERVGHSTVLHSLDSSFPQATDTALSEAAGRLAELPTTAVTVVDGLALAPLLAAYPHTDRLRLIALIHHPLADETGLSASEQAMYRRQETQALAQVDHVVVTSPATARSLQEEYAVAESRITVVLPGVDRPAQAYVPPSSREPLLLCVANLIPRKGHRYLLEALRRLRNRSWRLVCIGSARPDPATAALLQQRGEELGLSERIDWLGEVEPRALSDWYRYASLFVLPSLHEGYGMVFAEAICHGLPIVSTTAGAIPDTVPNTAGRLVAPGDAAALARVLAQLLDHPDERQQLAQGALHAAGALPRWEQSITEFVRVIEKVYVESKP